MKVSLIATLVFFVVVQSEAQSNKIDLEELNAFAAGIIMGNEFYLDSVAVLNNLYWDQEKSSYVDKESNVWVFFRCVDHLIITALISFESNIPRIFQEWAKNMTPIKKVVYTGYYLDVYSLGVGEVAFGYNNVEKPSFQVIRSFEIENICQLAVKSNRLVVE